MEDWDILAILFGVFIFAVIVFGWLPARRDAWRKRSRYRRMNSSAGDSGNYDPGSDYGGSSDSGGADGGGD